MYRGVILLAPIELKETGRSSKIDRLSRVKKYNEVQSMASFSVKSIDEIFRSIRRAALFPSIFS